MTENQMMVGGIKFLYGINLNWFDQFKLI